MFHKQTFMVCKAHFIHVKTKAYIQPDPRLDIWENVEWPRFLDHSVDTYR